MAPFVQHTEGSHNDSMEQLEIENNKVSDLTGEILTTHIKKRGVKRTLEESEEKDANHENNSFRNSSTRCSFKANVNKKSECVSTKRPIIDVGCNEYHQDFKKYSTILLTKLKEWTGALHQQSLHEINDFDSFFRSWCDNEGLDTLTENLVMHNSNILKWSEHRECNNSFIKADIEQCVSNSQGLTEATKSSVMVDNTTNNFHEFKLLNEKNVEVHENFEINLKSLHSAAGEETAELEKDPATRKTNLNHENSCHENSSYNETAGKS